MRDYLLEGLVTNYLRLVDLADANFVLQKLGSTIVTFFARSDSGWRLPLRHVLACSIGGHYVPEAGLPEVVQLLDGPRAPGPGQLKAVLFLAKTMAEDFSLRTSSAADEIQLNTRMGANCLDTLRLLRYSATLALEGEFLAHQRSVHNGTAAESSETAAVHLLRLVLTAVPYWVNMVKQPVIFRIPDTTKIQTLEDLAMGCIAISGSCLERDELTGTVLQMLNSLEILTPTLLRRAFPGYPLHIVTSTKADELRNSLLEGDFSTDAMLYVDLLDSIMSRVDSTKSDYLHDQAYTETVKILGKLLRCQGVAVIEDHVCHTAIQRLTELIEGTTDWEDVNDPAREFLKAMTVDACEASLAKIRLPLEQLSTETQDWDTDDRARFRDFRYDVQDFFQSAFTLLGNALIEEIANTILGQGTPPDWTIFEAGTFCLNAFVDTMSSEAGTYDNLITATLTSPAWNCLLQTSADIPDRALQTGITFIAESIGYLQRHPDRLVPVLNFLFSSLHLKASTSAASRTIYRLCDSHRAVLQEALPQFMDSMSSLQRIGEAERHRIYAAVAAMIQALPSDEAKVQPLACLLAPLGHVLGHPERTSTDREEVLSGCIDTVQTLASVGKGLRSPADVPIDLEAPLPNTIDFWTTGPGSILQREVLDMYHATLQRIQPNIDNIFIDGCCDFIKSGFTETHPSPFKFSDSIGLHLVKGLISIENPSIDNTLACATRYLASVSQEDIQSNVSGILYAVITIQQSILSGFQQTGQLPASNFASASLDFLGRSLGKWGSIWFDLGDSQETATVVMDLGLILMADADTLPRRSAAGFFKSFADFTSTDSGLQGETSARVSAVLQDFGPRILSVLLKLLAGECARSELESLSETLRRFVQKQPMLTKVVLREAVKQESAVLSTKSLEATTLEQRDRFLSQVEALRGARKTNQIVKDFWIACRGSEFGYTT